MIDENKIEEMNEELKEIIIGAIIFTIVILIAIGTYSTTNDLSPNQEDRNAIYEQ